MPCKVRTSKSSEHRIAQQRPVDGHLHSGQDRDTRCAAVVAEPYAAPKFLRSLLLWVRGTSCVCRDRPQSLRPNRRPMQTQNQPPVPPARCRTVGWWSGRRDLNSGPPAPKAGALPGCATPRHALRLHYTRLAIANAAGLEGRLSQAGRQQNKPCFWPTRNRRQPGRGRVPPFPRGENGCRRGGRPDRLRRRLERRSPISV